MDFLSDLKLGKLLIEREKLMRRIKVVDDSIKSISKRFDLRIYPDKKLVEKGEASWMK